MNVKKLIKKYLKSSPSELLAAAQKNYDFIYNQICKNKDSSSAKTILSGIIFICIGNDARISQYEEGFLYLFFKNLSKSEIDFIKDEFSKSDIRNITIKFIKEQPLDIKEAII